MDRLASLDLHSPLSEEKQADIISGLQSFSPHVEADGHRGIFWLDGSGIELIFGSHEAWGSQIFETMIPLSNEATVVVGFNRTICAAIAHAHTGFIYLDTPDNEAAKVAQVPLKYLDLPPKTHANLIKLGMTTVSALLALPLGGLRERYGMDVADLVLRLRKKTWDPIKPLPPQLPITTTQYFDAPESNTSRLMFVAKMLLRSLLRQIRHRHQVLAAVELMLKLDHHDPHFSRLEPAEPTLDEVQLTDLIRLRLEGITLTAGVTELTLTAEGIIADREQLQLFQKKSRRDRNAAKRALARLKAEFGKEAVVKATLKAAHLPEARFSLIPQDQVAIPHPIPGRQPFNHRNFKGQLIRRIYNHPIPLQNRPVVGPRGGHLLGMQEAPSTRIHGPFVVSGGWWTTLVHREYYYAETEAGEILWVYFDKRRRRWFLHGKVE